MQLKENGKLGRLWRVILLSIFIVLVLIVSYFFLVVDQGVERRELVGEPENYQIPKEIGGLSWTWVGEDPNRNSSVHAIPQGALIATAHGVFALDGKSGEEIWSFSDSSVGEISSEWHELLDEATQVSPDMQHVMHVTEYVNGDGGDGSSRFGFEVLDSVSGESVQSGSLDSQGPEEALYEAGVLTDKGRAFFSVDQEIGEYSLGLVSFDSESVWDKNAVELCDSGDPSSVDFSAFPEVLISSVECSEGTFLLGFDMDSGEVSWRIDSGSVALPDSFLRVRNVGDYAALSSSDSDFSAPGSLGVEEVVIDPQTGNIISEGPVLDEREYPVLTTGEGYLIDVNDREGEESDRGYILQDFQGDFVKDVVRSDGEISRSPSDILLLEGGVVERKLRDLVSKEYLDSGVIRFVSWRGEEVEIELPCPEAQGGLQNFLAVPGAVVSIDRDAGCGSGEGKVTVNGFR
ncbi:hypothetical protein [Nocardiopsis sp. LDBS1602]|uniref:hypothetical protein n=1 Tax=Nocardiopsis sp. LDBS1602 TaxID=3109597 RepID=UPI002DB96983|nr:hypothetical protein [Nocardiopsis sp. LDBS1602]MEC3895371.1 hypothetical protein [Nocardiopsis sp. LDBS1602]